MHTANVNKCGHALDTLCRYLHYREVFFQLKLTEEIIISEREGTVLVSVKVHNSFLVRPLITVSVAFCH